MEFGKHIGKGLWGLAGRALPSLYGVGIILFVIRSFPPVEFGVYTILQTIFTLAVSTGQSFALQPLVKFAAGNDDLSGPVTASAVLYAAFIAPVVVALSALGGPLGSLFNSHTAGELMQYVSLLLLASVPRNIASYLLQARLELRRLFVLDAIYSLGSLALIAVLVTAGNLRTAAGLMQVNLLMAFLSSLYGIALLFGRYSVRFAPAADRIKQAWDYGRYSLGASVSYTLFSQSDNLLIPAMTGPVELAVYNAAKVFVRAFDLLLQTIGTLLVPVVAKAHAQKDAAGLLTLAEKSLFFFTSAAAAMAAAFVLLGSPAIDLLYAGKYPDSAPILFILSAGGIFIPIIGVGAAYCNGTGVVRPLFMMNGVTAAAGVALVWTGAAAFGIRGAAAGMALTYALVAPLWLGTLRTRLGVPLEWGRVLSRRRDVAGFIRSRLGRP